mmetsp:Transcript_13538/g.54290  ORF Transcript_13538/g.54290 Transcript_13538/m.54290 type:complete len:83 (-) Transcript_13538:1242-1490(-)
MHYLIPTLFLLKEMQSSSELTTQLIRADLQSETKSLKDHSRECAAFPGPKEVLNCPKRSLTLAKTFNTKSLDHSRDCFGSHP